VVSVKATSGSLAGVEVVWGVAELVVEVVGVLADGLELELGCAGVAAAFVYDVEADEEALGWIENDMEVSVGVRSDRAQRRSVAAGLRSGPLDKPAVEK
jgi:hypothetical protein